MHRLRPNVFLNLQMVGKTRIAWQKPLALLHTTQTKELLQAVNCLIMATLFFFPLFLFKW